MKNTTSPIKRFLVYATLACVVSEPVFAAVTDISNVPLSSGTTSVTPNVMYILDDSGSMARDFLPDYVAPIAGTGQTEANAVMRRSDGTFDCVRGEPCYYSGGGNGFNGIYYDPNVNYKPGVQYTGATVQPATLSTTALEPDAYLGGTDVNLTNGTVSTDKVYCNSNNVCKRHGTTGNNDHPCFPRAALTSTASPTAPATRWRWVSFPTARTGPTPARSRLGLPEMMPTWRVGRAQRHHGHVRHVRAARSRRPVTGSLLPAHGNANIDGTSVPSPQCGRTATQFQFTYYQRQRHVRRRRASTASIAPEDLDAHAAALR